MHQNIFRYLICALFLYSSATPLRAAEDSAETTPALVSEIDAWAMLLQMMSRLHAAIERKELALIDPEEPIASVAVSSLIAEMRKATKPDNGPLKVRWTVFVREISNLHEAADKNDVARAAAVLQLAEDNLDKLRKTTNPEVLKAAQEKAERYSCPMHRDVSGRKGEACPKCGMQLERAVAFQPVTLPQDIIATVTTAAPLEPGQLAQAILHLSRPSGHKIGLDELLETHTRKLHLLLIDSSLSDYHHEHPEPTSAAGDYSFSFTPLKPGPYYLWVDLRPLPFGLQEYEQVVIPGKGDLEPIANTEAKLVADAEGFHFQLSFAGEVKAAQPVDATLNISKDGQSFDHLEPVMGAFAHLVAFNQDRVTVVHLHPLGVTDLPPTARGGPMLHFKFYATKEGFTRLFAQVQVNGQQIFAPFSLEVLKAQ